MRIESYLQASATLEGDKIAIVAGETRLGYRAFERLCQCFAATLVSRGVSRGDRVLVLMDNGWRAAVAIFGGWMAGAVVCPINPSAKAARLSQIVNSCRPSVILTEARLERVVNEVQEAANLLRIVTAPSNPGENTLDFDACLEGSPDGILPVDLSDTDLAMIIYTSGSTGEPKGVMLAHDNIEAAARSIVSYLGNTGSDILLGVLPMSFGYGLNQLVTTVMVGATLVIEKSFAFPNVIFERIRDEQVTGFALVPTMLSIMTQSSELSPSMFASLRYVTNAAAPLPVPHIDWFRAFLPDVSLFCMYGLTECTRATYLPPEELDSHRGSVGMAIPGTTVDIVDEEGYPVPMGQVGELVITGPHVMRGYWENAASTSHALRPDPSGGSLRLHTGDLFTRDEGGYLNFVARSDDIIKSRGEKVAPHAVEAVLHGMNGITEAIVFGVAHDVFGQAVKAVVVASDKTMTSKDVMRHCARYLEDHMIPKIIEFRDSIPKTDSGKASRRMAASLIENTGHPDD
jgi:long-chain acyl-CoA synthetase